MKREKRKKGRRIKTGRTARNVYEQKSIANPLGETSTEEAKQSASDTVCESLEGFSYIMEKRKMWETGPAPAPGPTQPAPNVRLDFSQFLAAQCPLLRQPGGCCFD